MKQSGPGASLREIERLGELARIAREGAPQGQQGLDEAWDAELQTMGADDRAQLEAVMRDMERARMAPAAQEDVLREWESLQAGLGGMSGPVTAPQRPRDYTFQPGNPFMDSANAFQEGVALYGAGELLLRWLHLQRLLNAAV